MNQKLAIQKLSQMIDENNSKDIYNDLQILKFTNSQPKVNYLVDKYNLKNL